MIYYSTVVVVQEVTPVLSSLGFAGMLVSFGQSEDPLRGRGALGVDTKATPSGRQQRCTFSFITFSSIQLSLAA